LSLDDFAGVGDFGLQSEGSCRCVFIDSLIHSFIHSFIHSLVHACRMVLKNTSSNVHRDQPQHTNVNRGECNRQLPVPKTLGTWYWNTGCIVLGVGWGVGHLLLRPVMRCFGGHMSDMPPDVYSVLSLSRPSASALDDPYLGHFASP